MGAAGNCASTLRVAVALFLIVTLTFPPPTSVYGGSSSSSSRGGREEEMMRRRKGGVLGSRPPGCMNKCMNCRPCEATLVIPPHHQQPFSHGDDDSTYYLLTWKCRCGDHLFHP